MITYQFKGETADLSTILAKPELQGKYIIAIRFSRWIGKDDNNNDIDLGGRVDVDTENFDVPVVYKTEVHATDFLVSTPKINDDPEKALDEAIAEMEKGQGSPKSIALIALSLSKYLKAKRVKLK